MDRLPSWIIIQINLYRMNLERSERFGHIVNCRFSNNDRFIVETNRDRFIFWMDMQQNCCEHFGWFVYWTGSDHSRCFHCNQIDDISGSLVTGFQSKDGHELTIPAFDVAVAPAELTCQCAADARGSGGRDGDGNDCYMFQLNLDRGGSINFFAWNCHNGYYSHEVGLKSDSGSVDWQVGI